MSDSADDIAALMGDSSFDLFQEILKAKREVANFVSAPQVDIEPVKPIEGPPSLIELPDDTKSQYAVQDTKYNTKMAISSVPENLDKWIPTKCPGLSKFVDTITLLPNFTERRIGGVMELDGCILSVPYVQFSLPIPSSLFNPDRMFYGLTAIMIPKSAKTQFLYDAALTGQSISQLVEDFEFEAEEASDFIGVYTEKFSFGSHYEDRIWVVVQCGDAAASNDWYEKLMDKLGDRNEFLTSPNNTGFFNMFADDARKLHYVPTQARVREKRLEILASLLKKLELDYDYLEKNGAQVIIQERNSIRASDDESVFFLLFGCFQADARDVLILNTPQQGILRLDFEQTKSHFDDYASIVPYDTGFFTNNTSMYSDVRDKIPFGIGPSAKLNDPTYRPMGKEFRERLSAMGIPMLNNHSQLYPLVVRMFE